MNYTIEMFYNQVKLFREEVRENEDYKFKFGKMYTLLLKEIRKEEGNLISPEKRPQLTSMAKSY
jgi:hypothetical protein